MTYFSVFVYLVIGCGRRDGVEKEPEVHHRVVFDDVNKVAVGMQLKYNLISGVSDLGRLVRAELQQEVEEVQLLGGPLHHEVFHQFHHCDGVAL